MTHPAKRVHNDLTEKVPPHAIEAERAVLGYALIDSRFVGSLLDRLLASDLCLDKHQTIFRALAECRRRGRPCDAIGVQEGLRGLGAFAPTEHPGLLAGLVNDAALTLAQAEGYLEIIKDAARTRDMIRFAADLVQRGFEGQGSELLLSATRKELARLEAAGPSPRELSVVRRLADVQPENVTWLWPGRLALGKLTILSGDPGLGKSFLSLDVAARLTTGEMWPDGCPAPSGTVVLLTAEDGVTDTVRARFDAAGGDPERVHVLEAIRDGDG